MNSLLFKEIKKIIKDSKDSDWDYYENDNIIKKKIERRKYNQLRNYQTYYDLFLKNNMVIDYEFNPKNNNEVQIYEENQINKTNANNSNNNINNSNKNKWKLKRVISGHNGWVRCIDIDPNNEYFITGSADRIIKIWDLAKGKLKLSLTGHVATIRDIKISDRLTYMFSCGEDKTIKCWDLSTNKVIRNYHGHLNGVYCLSLHPSLNLIASGGRDATVRLWDIRTKNEVQTFSEHEDVIYSIITQNNEPQIVSSSGDCTIITWDIIAGKSHKILTHHKKSIRSLTFHNENYTFLSAAADKIKVWKCPEGDFLRNFEVSENIKNSICINEDGIVAVGTDDGYWEFYDYDSGNKLQSIKSQPQSGSISSESGIFCSKFDKTGLRLITGECDKTIKIWEPILK